MHGKAHFVDILEPRRTQTGIFRFMTRDWYPTKTQELDKIYTPQDLKDITARSLYLETIIESESAKSGVSKEKLKKEVLSYIEEIGLDKKMHVIRWLGMFAIKLAFNMNIGIYVNEPAILKIKSSMGKNPVLFLPTHRSYADFCILTYLCYHYDIELPAVASGMDFYSMAVIGQVLRETCAFYIRRTLAGAPLYAAALRQYVRTLVAHYHAPVEFFLEGTRSRSNKSLPPKFGMLSMALAPLVSREVREVTVVPVHISYDRLLETGAFAYEHLGVPKPRESTTGLLKWLSTLNEEFGNMYINFGEPIAASEYFRDLPPAGADDVLKPLGVESTLGAVRAGVAALGGAAVGGQQAAAVTSAANLLAAALAGSLHGARPLTYPRLLDQMHWLKKVLLALEATVLADDMPREVERVLRVHARAWTLDAARCLRLRLHAPGKLNNTDVIMSAAHLRAWIPAIELQLAVNPLLQRLLPPALILLLLTDQHNTKADLRRRFDVMRMLLKYEFFYVEKDENQTFEKAFEFCLKWGVMSCGADGLVRAGGEGEGQGQGVEVGVDEGEESDAARLRFLLRWAVWPALTTLMLCIDIMTEHVSCSHEEALKLVQTRAADNGAHPYCLSRSAAACILRALYHAQALTTDNSKNSTTYHLVPTAMAQYRALVSSVLPHFDVDFSSKHPVFIEDNVKSRL